MKAKEFKLAMVQMLVKGGDKQSNIQHAVELINEASGNGAQVVLLPECMDLGWTHPTSLTEAEEIPDGSVCQALMQAAKENSVYVCSGLTEKDGETIYNAAVIIDKNGNVLCKQR
ncbi:MAG: carbon-nitrogen hydrolase family protein, partial [Lentisphaeria bacterium]|nr:carbon-nitrogen hydrolase family protein [Lentisphaeria bacterium]